MRINRFRPRVPSLRKRSTVPWRGFNAEILEYVEEIGRRKKAGELLTSREEEIWKGRSDGEFGRKLILEGLVEHYPGTLNGKGKRG